MIKQTIEKNLYYRRQFLLSEESCTFFSHWQHEKFGNFHLYSHPDIEVSSKTSADGNISAALVGYIIDPFCPEKSNVDILNSIVEFCDSFEKITDCLCSVSGRFILIIRTPYDTFLFHDPCGLRTVYYTQHKGKLFVASQPNIFKSIINLEAGEYFYSYHQSQYPKTNLEHWIPSGCSLYEEVYHLIPNHCLRFSTIEQIRYWPKQEIYQRSFNEVVTKASEILSGSIIAANKRFKLALPVTAGWDSRILLSASKNISDNIYFYTLQYRNLNSKSYDIRIPEKILNSLGQNHNVIDCRKTAPDFFRKFYEGNTSLSHMNDWGEIAYGMLNVYPQERVCLKGSCSEIVRCVYYKGGEHQEITSPDQIVSLERNWNTVPFIQNQISNWFEQSNNIFSQTKIDILDMFYWEHKMGSWQAQSQLEWDIIQETYTPFNNRELIELMLSIPPQLRCPPSNIVHKEIMKSLWPEALLHPINPSALALLNILRVYVRQFGIYESAKRIYTQVWRSETYM